MAVGDWDADSIRSAGEVYAVVCGAEPRLTALTRQLQLEIRAHMDPARAARDGMRPVRRGLADLAAMHGLSGAEEPHRGPVSCSLAAVPFSHGALALTLAAGSADVAVVLVDAQIGFGMPPRAALLTCAQVRTRAMIAVITGADGSTPADLKSEVAGFAEQLGFERVLVLDEGDGRGPLIATLVAEVLAARPRAIWSEAPARFAVRSAEHNQDRIDVSGAWLSGTTGPQTRLVALPSGSPVTIAGRQSGRALALATGAHLAGQELLAAADARPDIADQAAATLLWFSDSPLLPGRPYEVRSAAQTLTATVSRLRHRIDPISLAQTATHTLNAGEIGFCNLAFERELIFDSYTSNPILGSLLLFDKQSGELAGIALLEFPLRRATNIHWQALAVDRRARAELKGHQPCCLWLTGLSGSGKSTIASLLEKRLHTLGRHTYTLDGDNVRHGLNRDLGFTDADRVENIRRVAEVAKLFVDAGIIVMVSFISPFRAERRMARELFRDGEFLEIFVDTPLAVCEQRDPKGLYRKARAGQLKNFTGIDSAYEAPERAELRLRAGEESPEALVERILGELERRGMV